MRPARQFLGTRKFVLLKMLIHGMALAIAMIPITFLTQKLRDGLGEYGALGIIAAFTYYLATVTFFRGAMIAVRAKEARSQMLRPVEDPLSVRTFARRDCELEDAK